MEIEIDNSFNYASSISEAETNSDNIINSSIKKGDIITADNLVNPDIIKKCEQCYEDVRNSDYNREQNNLTKISNAIDSLPKFTKLDLNAVTWMMNSYINASESAKKAASLHDASSYAELYNYYFSSYLSEYPFYFIGYQFSNYCYMDGKYFCF